MNAIHPDQVILFGSYAYGKPNEDSDVDILVIGRSSVRTVDRVRKLDSLFFDRTIPMDFIWLTPREITKRLSGFDPFLQEILSKGSILYEK